MGHERSEYTREKWTCMLVSKLDFNPSSCISQVTVITFLRVYHAQEEIRPVYETIPRSNNAYPAPQRCPRVVFTLP